MAEPKLDIFKVLNAANSKSKNFYATLSDEEKKAYQPFLVSRWMSGTYDPSQIVMINEFLNPYLFTHVKHKDLLWDLTVVCNSGKKQKYSWNKLPSKLASGKPNALRAIMDYYQYSASHAADALQLLTRDQILEIAQELGWQPDDIAKIRREIKASGDPDVAAEEKPAKTEAASLLEF